MPIYLVSLKHDGDADFEIRDGNGILLTYEELNDKITNEDVEDINATVKFLCLECGGRDCFVDDQIRSGSEWTGLYGHRDLMCRTCKASRLIFDP